jgi:hypothetical protein
MAMKKYVHIYFLDTKLNENKKEDGKSVRHATGWANLYIRRAPRHRFKQEIVLEEGAVRF